MVFLKLGFAAWAIFMRQLQTMIFNIEFNQEDQSTTIPSNEERFTDIGCGFGSGGSLEYSHPPHRVRICQSRAKGTFTTTLFRALSQYDEKYSKLALKFLTQHTFIKNTGSLSLNGKILKAGFDSSGQCLRGLELLGLSGAQIGPVSLRPTQNSEGLGALHVKANINAYLQQFHTVDKSEQEKIKARNDRIKNFKVGVSMIPDEEVMELTPYLMKENLTINLDKLLKVHEVQEQNEKKQLSETQLQEGLRKDKQYNLIDFITINRDYIVSHTDPQIENQTQQILDSFLKTCQSIAREANLAVYTISNQNYSMEFLPPADKTGVDQYNTRYSFVSWKDIVAEITS